MASYTAVGKRIPRLEGAAKTVGETIYTGDVKLPRMLTAKVLRSPFGHARIKKLDTTRAKAYPGVAAVLTARDIPGHPRESADRTMMLLAYDEALFHGQPVAVALAEDPSVAEEALDLIDIEWEELPVVSDLLEAMQDGAPLVRASIADADRSEAEAHATIRTQGPYGPLEITGGTNISQRMAFDRGDVEKGFAEADLIVERTWRSSWVHQGYIEPQSAVVQYHASGEYTIWPSTQGQFGIRERVARVLGIPETKITVEPVEMGGGFGAKLSPIVAGLAAVLARETRRPVKLIMSRSEDLKAANPSPQGVVELKTGVKKDGSLTAIQGRIIFDAGAFPGSPLGAGMNLVAGYYNFPNMHLEGLEVMTNKASQGALRAPGTPQVTFAIESQMDIMARELGLDPLAFRLKNAVKEGDLQPNGRPYPRIGLVEVLERLKETNFWKDRNKKGPNQGLGIAVGGWMGGLQPSSAAVRLNADGTVHVLVGANDITGSNTSFAQIASEVLGIPIEKIQVQTGNTSSAPYAGMSAGSKTLRTVGNAVLEAAKDAREQMFRVAAQRLEARPEDLEAAEGMIRVKGSPEKAVPLEVLSTLTLGFGATSPPIVGKGQVGSASPAPMFTVQGVKLEVDPDTGEVNLLDSIIIQDVGHAINPMSVEGQMQGGVLQSLAIGLTEEMVFDEKGILRNPSLLDYRMMTALDVPNIQAIIVEVPTNEGPFGAKGVGEPPIAAGCAAVTNAIYDAVGARIEKMPATPERILRAMGKLDGN